jgi:hypothetical protein
MTEIGGVIVEQAKAIGKAMSSSPRKRRAELTVLERDEQIAEWVRLSYEMEQSAPFSKVGAGRGNESNLRSMLELGEKASVVSAVVWSHREFDYKHGDDCQYKGNADRKLRRDDCRHGQFRAVIGEVRKVKHLRHFNLLKMQDKASAAAPQGDRR